MLDILRETGIKCGDGEKKKNRTWIKIYVILDFQSPLFRECLNSFCGILLYFSYRLNFFFAFLKSKCSENVMHPIKKTPYVSHRKLEILIVSDNSVF